MTPRKAENKPSGDYEDKRLAGQERVCGRTQRSAGDDRSVEIHRVCGYVRLRRRPLASRKGKMVIQTYITCSDAEIEPETGVFDPEIERVRPLSMGWRLDKPSADYEGMKLVGRILVSSREG